MNISHSMTADNHCQNAGVSKRDCSSSERMFVWSIASTETERRKHSAYKGRSCVQIAFSIRCARTPAAAQSTIRSCWHSRSRTPTLPRCLPALLLSRRRLRRQSLCARSQDAQLVPQLNVASPPSNLSPDRLSHDGRRRVCSTPYARFHSHIQHTARSDDFIALGLCTEPHGDDDDGDADGSNPLGVFSCYRNKKGGKLVYPSFRGVDRNTEVKRVIQEVVGSFVVDSQTQVHECAQSSNNFSFARRAKQWQRSLACEACVAAQRKLHPGRYRYIRRDAACIGCETASLGRRRYRTRAPMQMFKGKQTREKSVSCRGASEW
ncbi:uncharacterized protein LOC125942879 [Dermacentor silvarum]|uniref:uncharacterized protein LOC125942879 n=1 Tax=Dermacentor silvarum TaxID=543639 RepID=UPI00210122A5|nr:uncharacterized protein LOC125942879 [Dermacentor silvarum]